MTQQEILKKKKYTFNFWTGYGYREIAQHTVSFYPVSVTATTQEEAIEKCLKKMYSLRRYNDCYTSSSIVPVIDEKEDKIGVCWLEDKTIKWEGEICFHSPGLYDFHELQPLTLPTVEYKHHCNTFAVSYCTGRTIYSYAQFLRKTWKHFNRDASDLDKLFFKVIERISLNERIPIQEREQCIKLKLEKENEQRRDTTVVS